GHGMRRWSYAWFFRLATPGAAWSLASKALVQDPLFTSFVSGGFCAHRLKMPPAALARPGKPGHSEYRRKRTQVQRMRKGHAYHCSTAAQTAPSQSREQQEPGAGKLPPASRRLHPCLHHHPEEAELRPA